MLRVKVKAHCLVRPHHHKKIYVLFLRMRDFANSEKHEKITNIKDIIFFVFILVYPLSIDEVFFYLHLPTSLLTSPEISGIFSLIKISLAFPFGYSIF